MSAYKKFTAQDYAIVPFNAHKQYSYGSSSAASNRVTHYDTRWTSESISVYSSASSHPNNELDPINTVKYNQIDHLFYKDFITNHANLLGQGFHYLKQKRNLYQKANILSIPTGLYGAEIKPGSFLLSSSNHEVVDDKYGNLIIKNADTHNYPTDVRTNVFRLDPIKGFKHYDLGLFDDYALKLVDPLHPEAGTYKAFWKKGKLNPNAPTMYTTPADIQEIDDSYFLNRFRYKSVNFESSSLGSNTHKFPSIKFNSITGSNVMVPHDERFNFDKEDNFAISFHMEPRTLNEVSPAVPKIGDKLQGGLIYHIDSNNVAYIVNKHIQMLGGTAHSTLWGDTSTNAGTGTDIGTGLANTRAMSTGSNGIVLDQKNPTGEYKYLGHHVLNQTLNGYSDWYIPSTGELNEIIVNLNPFYSSDWGVKDYGFTTHQTYPGGVQTPFPTPLINSDSIITSTQYSSTHFQTLKNDIAPITGSSSEIHSNNRLEKNKALTSDKFYLAVRHVNLSSADSYRRDIISKSTTKTVIPPALEGRSEILNTHVSGNMQPREIPAESQFPFEIYLQSQSLYFDRSDGYKKHSINSGDLIHYSSSYHVLCQNSASRMEIYIDGVKRAETDSTLNNQTRNTANLYIGSKGKESTPDVGANSSFRYYNGKLSCINIWEDGFNSTEVTRISESINASPYIGNIFYQNGFATITHPNYHGILGNIGVGDMEVEDNFIVDSEIYYGINKLEFQGTHKIWEHEYQCTVTEHEYNSTMNTSARKSISNNNYKLADFATGSLFKPYITTIGLYDENNDLLVIGKLTQPIKTSNETDTTFIVRWDT